MSLGEDARDELAHALTETEFDAVERDGIRAEWTEDGSAVAVRNLDTGETFVYNAEDLIRATSDTEVRNARAPENDAG